MHMALVLSIITYILRLFTRSSTIQTRLHPFHSERLRRIIQGAYKVANDKAEYRELGRKFSIPTLVGVLRAGMLGSFTLGEIRSHMHISHHRR